MKKVISLLMILALTAAFFSFSACKKREVENEETVTEAEHTKSTTEKPVEIAVLPQSAAEIVEALNTALDYVDVYCYRYTKSVKCSVDSLNVGALSAASNASAAFKSIFGSTDYKKDYSYETAPESFKANFISSRFTADEISDSNVRQEGDSIILSVSFPNEYNPSDNSGALSRLSAEYISPAKVQESLGEFSSSAGSVNVSASAINVTATINAHDSSLQKLAVSYNENFSLSDVKLVQLEGPSVTAGSKTVITYSEIG